MLVVGLLISWLVCGIAAGHIHEQRGRSMAAGFWAGILLGPLGVLLAIAASPDVAGRERRAIAANTHRQCPDCAELVKVEARICRFCSCALPPAPEAGPVVIRNPY